jgi:guanylate kinase
MAIYALIGQSASGKSTVERSLTELGYSRIISYTTRPARKGETDGVDYHFIDTDTFTKLQDQDFFAETARYRDWYYGLSLDNVDYENKDYIVVVTIQGYDELVKVCGKENIVGIHIKVEERDRIVRQLFRGDDVDEVIRRIHTDRVDFAGVEDACDYTVMNHNIDLAVAVILNIIEIQQNAKESNIGVDLDWQDM